MTRPPLVSPAGGVAIAVHPVTLVGSVLSGPHNRQLAKAPTEFVPKSSWTTPN